MAAQARLPLLRLVVVLIATMLAAGSGLPGLVASFGGSPTHVCTCSTGGSHAACPVCNPRLAEHRSHGRLREPAVDGTPCGDGRAPIVFTGQPGVLPQAGLAFLASFALQPLALSKGSFFADTVLEPSTPPPRIALV